MRTLVILIIIIITFCLSASSAISSSISSQWNLVPPSRCYISLASTGNRKVLLFASHHKSLAFRTSPREWLLDIPPSLFLHIDPPAFIVSMSSSSSTRRLVCHHHRLLIAKGVRGLIQSGKSTIPSRHLLRQRHYAFHSTASLSLSVSGAAPDVVSGRLLISFTPPTSRLLWPMSDWLLDVLACTPILISSIQNSNPILSLSSRMM